MVSVWMFLFVVFVGGHASGFSVGSFGHVDMECFFACSLYWRGFCFWLVVACSMLVMCLS